MTGFDLNQLQHWMQTMLVGVGNGSATSADSVIAASSRQSPHERLAIYQRSYEARLLKCMREQFPALCYALGDALFYDFCRDYLRTYPSRSYTLYELGGRFPRFLSETRPDKDSAEKEVWITFMVELACFERELFVLFDAEGAETMQLASVATNDSQLRIQPAITLGRYSFPVMDYYLAVRRKEQPELPPCQPVLLAMVRKDYQTHILSLSAPHYVFLQAMQSGLDVTEALQETAQQLNLPLQKVTRSWQSDSGIRQRWLNCGMFVQAG